ncbi:MAG: sigma-70 family RNA polymerase sigma factor [Ilumatobacteraceae bacterium]
MSTDHELITAAMAGDRAAMDSLLRAHHDRVYVVCRRITGNDADAADATQEALIAIVRGLGRFDGRSSFSTWVYRVATNASLDELRRRKRRPTLVIDDDLAGHESADHQGAARIDGLGDRMAIDEALRMLPEDFRVPLVLRDVCDLDYADIAATLDIPIGTVKSRIARGRGALAQILRAGNQIDPDDRPTTAP